MPSGEPPSNAIDKSAKTRRPADASTNTRRIEAFSDGVFAIAITLLVLDIRVPTASDIGHAGGLIPALLDNWPAYLSYLAAFATIGAVWLNHHAAYARIARVDRTILIWNLLLLLATSFIPFPTRLVADQLSEGIFSNPARVATALYALVGIACCLPWVIIYRHVARNPELLREPYTSAAVGGETRRGWIGVAGYALAGVLAIAVPLAAIVLFLAGSVYYIATASGDAPRRKK